MKLIDIVSKRSEQSVPESTALVGSIGTSFREACEADASVYSRHYRGADVTSFSNLDDLLRAISRGYDIVHLFCSLSANGFLTDHKGASLSGSDLITACCKAGTKLLWIANGNKADGYVKGFNPAGQSLNLIMTIDRNGEGFSLFLDKLLSRVSEGQTLPVAWASLAPQAEGSGQVDLPSCIFFAGKPEAKLA